MWISKRKYNDIMDRIEDLEFSRLKDSPVNRKEDNYYDDFKVFSFLTQTKDVSAYDLIWQVCYALWCLIDHLGLKAKYEENPRAILFVKKGKKCLNT